MLDVSSRSFRGGRPLALVVIVIVLVLVLALVVVVHARVAKNGVCLEISDDLPSGFVFFENLLRRSPNVRIHEPFDHGFMANDLECGPGIAVV